MRVDILGIDLDDVMSNLIKKIGVEGYKSACRRIGAHTGFASQRTINFYLCLVGLDVMAKELGIGTSGVDPIEFINSSPYELSPGDGFGYIYFIQEQNGENIKIGYSSNPVRRLLLMQGGNSSKLNILAVIPGSRQDEKEFHKYYKVSNVRGEWFKPSDGLMDFIGSIKAKVQQTCPDCGKVRNIFEEAPWKVCCMLNFDFPFPVKIINKEGRKIN